MDKRIKLGEKEMCNYFIKEQKALEYGYDFFKKICAYSMTTDDCKFVNDEVLPLSCYNIMDELLYSIDNELNYAVRGGFVKACTKQAYIRIGIDTNSSILGKRLKRTIRHEIIHYYLWLLNLPFDDDSLEFWCMCYMFDGGAYEELSLENQKYYELFKELYDTYVIKLPPNMCCIIAGQMITHIKETPCEKYADFVIDMVEKIKRIYKID